MASQRGSSKERYRQCPPTGHQTPQAKILHPQVSSPQLRDSAGCPLFAQV